MADMYKHEKVAHFEKYGNPESNESERPKKKKKKRPLKSQEPCQGPLLTAPDAGPSAVSTSEACDNNQGKGNMESHVHNYNQYCFPMPSNLGFQ